MELHQLIASSYHQEEEEREGGRCMTHRCNIVRKLMQLS